MDTKTIVQGNKPEAEAVAEVVRRSIEPRIIPLGQDVDGIERGVMVVPQGLEVKGLKPLLDAYRTAPERRRGTAHVADLDSFIGLVNRFKDEDSSVFADLNPKAPCLLCVLDYHRQGAAGAPRFGHHRVRYTFPLSDEWVAWTTHSGTPFGQRDFADFIENRLADTLDPAGAGDGVKKFAELLGCSFGSPQRLLELSRGLTVHVGQRVTNQLNLATGESQLQFAEEHHDDKKQPLRVPGAFLIGIRVFRSGHAYQMAARLRYRVQSGAVVWSYDIYRQDAVFDDAIAGACEKAKKETALPLFAGTPESEGS